MVLKPSSKPWQILHFWANATFSVLNVTYFSGGDYNFYGSFTLHRTETGTGKWVSLLRYVLYTLQRDREPLFSIVPITFPVPVPVLCSVHVKNCPTVENVISSTEKCNIHHRKFNIHHHVFSCMSQGSSLQHWHHSHVFSGKLQRVMLHWPFAAQLTVVNCNAFWWSVYHKIFRETKWQLFFN